MPSAPRLNRRVFATVLVAVVATVSVAACQPDPFPGYAPATFEAHGSDRQVWVVDAQPGNIVRVVDRNGGRIAQAKADAKGSALFHGIAPGEGYRVIEVPAWRTPLISPPLTVLDDSPAPPSAAVYDQTLPVGGWAGHEKDGYGYLTTRDGTKLSIMVRLPGPPEKGPYPTVIEYSGYDPANPDSPQPMTQISGLLGYATVGINMRGTGCSGGVFDYFERLQSLDGYDAIETIARQPWVMHNKVGMVGISYPGISQLFVGSTQPPSLAAITPLSVIDNTATTLYPGGILNTGFALSWGQDRADQAKEGGQKWAADRIEAGDQTCIANQKLRLQTPDLMAKIYANTHYDPAVADPVNPTTFVDRINVPTYLACQWQDEQTGGHCAALVQHFTGAPKAWFTFTNGTHLDSLDPATLVRWYDFLELYVARRKPANSGFLRSIAPFIYQEAAGLEGVQMPADPLDATADYPSALAAFEAYPRVRVLFDNGAGTATPGNPGATFERTFDTFPVPGVQARAWYMGEGGELTDAPPTEAASGSDSYQGDATAADRTSFNHGTGDVWVAQPDWEWVPPSAGTYLAYETAPLATGQVLAGFGSVDLWLRSNVSDTDLQATLTEVRPDGQEELVQSGWLRASERKLAPGSTDLRPLHSGFLSDVEAMPAGQFSLARIELYPFAHAVRPGSRLRIIVSSPGGDRPFWKFAQPPVAGTVTNEVARTPAMASRIVLPVVGDDVPTPLPPCWLRGQPCRDAAWAVAPAG